MKEVSKSENQTRSLAKKIAQKLSGGEVLALFGDLGSGKTLFTKALAKELGFMQTIISPTFNIVKVYTNEKKSAKINKLCHVDLYRINSVDEIENLGILEYFGKNKTVCAIEWSEKIIKLLPSGCIKIYFSYIDEPSSSTSSEYKGGCIANENSRLIEMNRTPPR